ncbi:MAG: hypothetical protein M3Z04_11940 [Chloroflexota bacterium]|nr:hypothetical protein [Chloroflexota bacterium]
MGLDLLELPLWRACSCGTSLGLLLGVRPAPDSALEYSLLLEDGWESMVWWATHAEATCYAAAARVASAFYEDGIPPVHDLLDSTGTPVVLGTHRPDLHLAHDPIAAHAAQYAPVWAEALQQDNYGDFHRVLAEAGLLEPLPPRPVPPVAPE